MFCVVRNQLEEPGDGTILKLTLRVFIVLLTDFSDCSSLVVSPPISTVIPWILTIFSSDLSFVHFYRITDKTCIVKATRFVQKLHPGLPPSRSIPHIKKG